MTDFSKIPAMSLGVIFLITLTIVCPGFLILYHFKPLVVEKYDFARLLLFSCSITVPYWIANAFMEFGDIWFNWHADSERQLLHSLGLRTSIITALLLYTALIFAYFGNYSLQYFVQVTIWLHAFRVLKTLKKAFFDSNRSNNAEKNEIKDS